MGAGALAGENGPVTGIAIYLALAVAAAAAVAFGVNVPGPDAQRRVRGLLALGSVYLAVATAFAGWTSFMRPWWHALVLLLAAMILGNCIGLLAGFPTWRV